MSSDSVHPANSEVLKADAVAYATSWQKSTSFPDMQTTIDLGLPVNLTEESTSVGEEWTFLQESAMILLEDALPELRSPLQFGLPGPMKRLCRL